MWKTSFDVVFSSEIKSTKNQRKTTSNHGFDSPEGFKLLGLREDTNKKGKTWRKKYEL